VPRFSISPLGLTEGSTKFKLKGWKCYRKKLQCSISTGSVIGGPHLVSDRFRCVWSCFLCRPHDLLFAISLMNSSAEVMVQPTLGPIHKTNSKLSRSPSTIEHEHALSKASSRRPGPHMGATLLPIFRPFVPDPNFVGIIQWRSCRIEIEGLFCSQKFMLAIPLKWAGRAGGPS